MKTIACVAGFLVVLLSNVNAEMFRKTVSDLYQESYQAQMQRLDGMSSADVRADEYRKIYERCDLNHNCTNVTADSFQEQQNNSVTPFTYSHVWQ